mmetsp:Transcript_38793/g.58512  ORF Transcript_38793/g.58512 Transcript_38793/m.58512 type:complete len:223 (-) Transcript_38793:101-769(-)
MCLKAVPFLDVLVLVHLGHPSLDGWIGFEQAFREHSEAPGLEESAVHQPHQVGDRHMVAAADVATCLFELRYQVTHDLRELRGDKFADQSVRDLVFFLPISRMTKFFLLAVLDVEQGEQFPPSIIGKEARLLHLKQLVWILGVEGSSFVKAPRHISKHGVTLSKGPDLAIVISDFQHRHLTKRGGRLDLGPILPLDAKVLKGSFSHHQCQTDLLCPRFDVEV